MRIEPISFVKKNAASLDLEEPIVVTQNGKPVYVIESFEDRERRQEATALLKLLSFGAKDEAEGKTLSGDQVLNNIRAKYLDNK
ncbi:type II toxin-antitoxin system Phd/YefM family antitoxin [Endozoicomonas acroporae]|uniref:type II toxin-antitoxin system Phd/YefM family antitoxin n=1 Tax=Endozoicomonas acroporae TaxID=1701104 RepID=UPI000C7831E9|nr:type II toxin-antitoxin system Phd/YefM family antitoxin [Endozoicomonas acroporae]